MTTLENALREWDRVIQFARSLIAKKGEGYSANFLASDNDTFGNLRVSKILSVVDSASQGALVRFLDKVQRVCSHDFNARKNKKFVDDITLDNDVGDAINYLIYWNILYKEERDK
jgi:hypothetical protein